MSNSRFARSIRIVLSDGAGWSMSLAGLLHAPGIGASDAEIDKYYADPSTATAALVWIQVLVFATIAFLWFVGVVRGRLGDREPKLFGTVFFGIDTSAAAVGGPVLPGETWNYQIWYRDGLTSNLSEAFQVSWCE